MFDPEYLYQVSDEENEEVDTLEIILLGLILSNMRLALKNPNQKKKLAETLFKEAVKEINKFNKKSDHVIKKIFDDAAKKVFEIELETLSAADITPLSIKDDTDIMKTINSGFARTKGTIKNWTKTTAISTQRDFIKAVDDAFLKMIPTAADMDKVIFDSLVDLARKGVFKVEYPVKNGIKRIDHADVAIRRALITGLNQTYAEAILINAEKTNQDLVQVSQHYGARTGDGIANHKAWQGKIYSINGKTEKYQNLRIKTGYGTGAGLCGWNCRHSFGIYVEGQTEKLERFKEKADVTINGKTMPYYEGTQKQRHAERQIRKYKREYYLAKETKQPIKPINDKINYWTNEVDKISKILGTPRRKGSEVVVSKF